MVLPQEIPIIKNIIKFFSKEFNTQISYSKDENLIEKLGLENKNSVEKGLFYAVFQIFQKNGLKFDKVVELEKVTKNVEELAIKSIKNAKIHKVNNDYLLIVSTKFIEGFTEKGKSGKISKRNDIAILDYGLKKFYCQSNYIKINFEGSLLEKNIAPKRQKPQITTSKSFSKIFGIKDLLIYDIEFHKVKDIDILDFYIRAGSKKSPINKKIKEIISKVIKDFGAYNLKSILVSVSSKSKERIRFNMIEEGMGSYKLIMAPKGVSQETKRELKKLFLKNGINLEYPLKFKDEPIESTIFSLLKKKKIKGYDLIFKKEIQNWDTNKILFFDKNRLKVNEKNLIKTLEKIVKNKFDLIKDQEIKLSGKKIKGNLLVRKEDGKRLFCLIRNSLKNYEEIEKLFLNGGIPFFYIETKLEEEKHKNSFLFTSLNKLNEKEFNFLLEDILDNPQLYKNLENNFKWSLEKIKKIKNFLLKKNSQKKGESWELICNSILNYIFKESFPLGKSYLPDGITFFTKKDSIIWDAKALNGKKSYLNQSVKTKDRKNIKDTFYIEVFKEKDLSFDYYAYLTSGVKKEDFEKVKKKINSYMKEKKIDVKIICLTDKWIKDFAEYFSLNENLLRVHKDRENFLTAIKEEFKSEYLDNFNKTLFDSVGKEEFNENLTEIRKKVKEKMKVKG